MKPIQSLGIIIIFVSLILVTIPAGGMRGHDNLVNADSVIFLPVVQHSYEGSDCSDDSVTGALAINGLVSTPCGVSLGALSNTITETLQVDISTSWVSTHTVSLPAQVLGEYYQLSAAETKFTPSSDPFILAFPVPVGADTSHLALAVLQPSEEKKDVKISGQKWTYLEGVYDAGGNLFLTTIASIDGSGRGMALVEHPGMVSPPNGSGPTGAHPAAPTVPNFTVNCQFFSSATQCNASHESAMASLLPGMYARLQDQLGFAHPRLRSRIDTLGISPNIYNPFGLQAYIEPHDYGDCNNAAGYYEPYQSRLVLCMDPAVGLDPDYDKVLLHEYFHATEYGYPSAMRDLRAGIEQDWIIEGMAQASEESANGSEMFRSTVGGWVELHKVDIELTSEIDADAYFAQDFWVYYGQKNSKDLSYLQDILNKGTFVGDVVDELGDGEYLFAYFEWARNQVMEANVDFNGALTTPCELESGIVDHIVNMEFDFEDIDTQFTDFLLGPLNSVVVKVTFDHSYDGAAGYVFPYIPAQLPDAGLALEHKFYKEDESGCDTLLSGDRIYTNVQPSDTFYVLISNTDYADYYDYRLGFEVWPPPP